MHLQPVGGAMHLQQVAQSKRQACNLKITL